MYKEPPIALYIKTDAIENGFYVPVIAYNDRIVPKSSLFYVENGWATLIDDTGILGRKVEFNEINSRCVMIGPLTLSSVLGRNLHPNFKGEITNEKIQKSWTACTGREVDTFEL